MNYTKNTRLNQLRTLRSAINIRKEADSDHFDMLVLLLCDQIQIEKEIEPDLRNNIFLNDLVGLSLFVCKLALRPVSARDYDYLQVAFDIYSTKEYLRLQKEPDLPDTEDNETSRF